MQSPRHAVAWHDDAPNPSSAATPASEPLPDRVDWVVIGGGYAGLSAARRAAERGARVLLAAPADVAERDLIRWAEHRQFPIIPCTLCGSQDNLQRKQVGMMWPIFWFC